MYFSNMVRSNTVEPKARRVTIMIADDLDKKIRNRQAKLIQTDHQTHSFSSVLNEMLRKSLRSSP